MPAQSRSCCAPLRPGTLRCPLLSYPLHPLLVQACPSPSTPPTAAMCHHNLQWRCLHASRRWGKAVGRQGEAAVGRRRAPATPPGAAAVGRPGGSCCACCQPGINQPSACSACPCLPNRARAPLAASTTLAATASDAMVAAPSTPTALMARLRGRVPTLPRWAPFTTPAPSLWGALLEVMGCPHLACMGACPAHRGWGCRMAAPTALEPPTTLRRCGVCGAGDGCGLGEREADGSYGDATCPRHRRERCDAPSPSSLLFLPFHNPPLPLTTPAPSLNPAGSAGGLRDAPLLRTGACRAPGAPPRRLRRPAWGPPGGRLRSALPPSRRWVACYGAGGVCGCDWAGMVRLAGRSWLVGARGPLASNCRGLPHTTQLKPLLLLRPCHPRPQTRKQQQAWRAGAAAPALAMPRMASPLRQLAATRQPSMPGSTRPWCPTCR